MKTILKIVCRFTDHEYIGEKLIFEKTFKEGIPLMQGMWIVPYEGSASFPIEDIFFDAHNKEIIGVIYDNIPELSSDTIIWLKKLIEDGWKVMFNEELLEKLLKKGGKDE